MSTAIRRNKENQITYFEVDLPSWHKIKIIAEFDISTKKLKYFWQLTNTAGGEKVLICSTTSTNNFQSCCKDLITSIKAWINAKPRKPGQNPTNGEKKLVKNLERALEDV